MLPDHPDSASVEVEFDTVFTLLLGVQSSRVRSFWQGLLEPLPVGVLGGLLRVPVGRLPTDGVEVWADVVGQRATRASFRVDVYRPATSHPAWMLSGYIAYLDGDQLRYFRRRQRVGHEAFAEVEYSEINADAVSP